MRPNDACRAEYGPHDWKLQLTDAPDGTVTVVATLRLAAPAVFICRITGFTRAVGDDAELEPFGKLGFSVVARELPDSDYALAAFDRLREQLTAMTNGKRPTPRCAAEHTGFRRPRR